MACQTLLPDPNCLTLDSLSFREGAIIFNVKTTASTVACSLCHHGADRVHSRYRRKLLDLPWQGNTVHIEMIARKFFCDNRECKRRIFAEPLPTVAKRYARKTVRLADVLRELTYMAGGEAAARIARALGLLVSPDTLLSQLKRASTSIFCPPRVLGIDDFAFRRGRRYGTVLVDLEKRCPVDLLPDRDPETVAAWLREHPGVEIISRDRGACYVDGATKGAPDAVQVADRWHLIKNLGDTLERLLTRQYRVLQKAENLPQEPNPPLPAPKPTLPSPFHLADMNVRQERRQARFNQLKGLLNEGHSQREVSRRTGYSRKLIRKVAESCTLPSQAARPRRLRTLQPFADYLRQRWQEGIYNATRLHEEITIQGFRGNVSAVQRFVQSWRDKKGSRINGRCPRPVLWSPRQVSWLLTNPDHPRVTEEQRAYLAHLTDGNPIVASAQQLALGFCQLVRKREVSGFPHWLEQAARSDVPELKAFARGLEQDRKAVEAGLSLEWGNGQVEGQVNRLKLLKRAMYGRASFALLKARVLPIPKVA